jgi:membrane-bound lytic murein transglycosylase A
MSDSVSPLRRRYRIIGGLILGALALLYGCAAKEQRPILSPPPPEVRTQSSVPMRVVPIKEWPRFTDDMAFDGLSHAIDRSVSYLTRIASDTQFRFGGDTYSSSQLIASLASFKKFIETRPAPAALNEFLAENFTLYQSIGGETTKQVLFTGYYEPYIRGSTVKTEQFRYPVYGRPKDLVTVDLSQFASEYQGKSLVGRLAGGRLVPYHDRDAIENGAIISTALPIAWVDDPIDLFFLQIQGSGKIYYNNGEAIQAHYDVSNGKPYRSIGKLLIEQGKISRDEMSMQRLRAYIKSHPEEAKDIFSYNPSYVFFRTEKDGPLGCLGVKLTPGRSLAVDRQIFPMATLAFIRTEKPLVEGKGAITGWTTCSRFVLNQDTGGAIRGPGRADIFWGNGEYAELAAGYMQHMGELYFFVLKNGRV